MNIKETLKKLFSNTEEIRIEVYEHYKSKPIKIYTFIVPMSNVFLSRDFSEFYSEYMKGTYLFISKSHNGFRKTIMKFYINY